MSITQEYYGKVAMKKVGEEMSRVNSRIQPDNKNGMSK